jgi:hypothetical protein
MTIPDIAIISTALGILVILTSALTELFKAMFKALPVQITATIISLVLTVCTVLAYININSIVFEWYYLVGAIVAGFMVSYTAQFGYDKLNEILEKLRGGKNGSTKSD